MRKILFLIVLTVFNFSKSYSQDLITKKNGEDLKVKVLEVNISEIKYKKFDNLNGPIFSILKSEVLIIRYENGTKDIFNFENKEITTIANSQEAVNDLFRQGQTDASKYYKGYKGASTGTLLTSIVASPLIGLIPAIACSSSQPEDQNLNYPNSELMKKPDYYNGYTQQAKKIKQNKVWKNWGIAIGVNLLLIAVIVN
jgi:hypothetical protein